MRRKYDVIIIGAGPAGLECANQLNGSGLSVLLLEKNKVIGPKNCAGGMTHLGADFGIPNDKARIFPKQAVFISGKEYEITIANPLMTISRFDLGQHQLSRIKASRNIKILNRTPVTAIRKDSIATDKGTFYFKTLVGADGSNSAVRKYLGLESDNCIGIYYEIPKITDRFIWHFDPKLLKSGYIWAFPHKDCTNIGIYFNPRNIPPKDAKDILKKYLMDNNYEIPENGFRGAQINSSYKGHAFGNIFLIGDAAGFASRLTGEGISFALISGREIGRKILEPEYKVAEISKILSIKKRHELALRLFEMFPRFQKYFLRVSIRLIKRRWFQEHFGW